MTYTVGSTILAADYNGFVETTVGANINATWNTTYGQTALGQVAAAGTVTATQWSGLVNTLTSMAAHSNTTITSRTAPVAGNIIAIFANVNTDITNCWTNRANAVSSGTQNTAWTGTASQTSGTGSGQTGWQLTFTDTMTFANASAATAFFGAGGLVKTQFSKTSVGLDADADWNNLIGNVCANSGVFLAGANSANIAGTTYTGTTKFGGSGTPTTLATNTNFTNLTTTPATLYKQFDSGAAYSSNFVQIAANVNSNLTPTVLTLVTTWFSAGDEVDGANAQISGGTATSSGITFGTAPATVVTYYPPETTNLTAVWGAPTVASTVSNAIVGYAATYLVVAGGGSGGTGYGGGGGAGGLYTGTLYLNPGATYTAVVGLGGAAQTSNSLSGLVGANSTLSGNGIPSFVTLGGGFGGAGGNTTANVGGAGGAGGGGGSSTVTSVGNGGTAQGGQGYPGSEGEYVSAQAARTGGGGGGASAPGTTSATIGAGGVGGAGTASSITGSSLTYAGGGGGGGTATNGAGGAGGGGGAGATGTAGTDGFGGGGGGATGATSGKGGNGVVILAMATSSYTGTTTGSPTITTSGSNTIIKFTAGSGTYVA